MIVEFIGAPGSGKTTVLPMVIEALQERGIRARSVVEAARPYAQRTPLGQFVCRLAPPSLHGPLLWQVFYHQSSLFMLKFAVKHPRLIWQVLVSQKRRPIAAKTRQRRVLFWFFRLVGYYEFLTTHTRPNEALLFDEGFIHRVVQLNASHVEAPDSGQVFAYVDLLPRPDLVIHTQARSEVCEQRIYCRGIWEHFRSNRPAEVAQYVANAHLVVDLAVDHAKAKGWRVVEVDNGGDDLNALRAELRGKLMSLQHLPHAVKRANLS